jgi:outer membrane protein assembly factor BamE (lipoprotein component of BamABCDE complex)
MKAGKCIGLGTLMLGFLLAGGLASASGYIYPSDLVDKIKIGVTTSKQVTEILGPPAGISHFPRRGVETWDYTTLEPFNKKKSGISIEIDGSGIVRNVIKIPTYGP